MWFSGNLYEGLALAPNQLANTVAQLEAWNGYFTVTNPIYYFVPITHLAVIVLWGLTIKGRIRDEKWNRQLVVASLLTLLAEVLTVYIVLELNLSLFFGKELAPEAIGKVYQWNALNAVRVGLVFWSSVLVGRDYLEKRFLLPLRDTTSTAYGLLLFSLGIWFFGSLYESVVIYPNLLDTTNPKLDTLRSYFTWTSPRFFFVPLGAGVVYALLRVTRLRRAGPGGERLPTVLYVVLTLLVIIELFGTPAVVHAVFSGLASAYSWEYGLILNLVGLVKTGFVGYAVYSLLWAENILPIRSEKASFSRLNLLVILLLACLGTSCSNNLRFHYDGADTHFNGDLSHLEQNDYTILEPAKGTATGDEWYFLFFKISGGKRAKELREISYFNAVDSVVEADGLVFPRAKVKRNILPFLLLNRVRTEVVTEGKAIRLGER